MRLNTAFVRAAPLWNMVRPKIKLKEPDWIKTAVRMEKHITVASMACSNPGKIGAIMLERVAIKHVRKVVAHGHSIASIRRDSVRTNGIGGRTWFSESERKNGRIVKNMVIVFHDANKAGRHLDIHIGNVSFVARISGKPVESKLRFNRIGGLTEESKKVLIDHLREEILNRSRFAQNLDHSPDNARSSWSSEENGPQGYGQGKTRQVIVEESVEIVFVDEKSDGKTAKIFAPFIWKHGQMYIHKLYPGNDKKAPIVIWGVKKNDNLEFEDRLHLKMVKDLEEFKRKVDPRTVTRKVDGASAYVVTSKKSSSFWSPRISKETGRRIEYSHKIPELVKVRGFDAIGMGELLFKRKFDLFNPFQRRMMTAAEIGGILNADSIRPINVIPEFRMYRMDSWNGERVIDLDFWRNRVFQDEWCRATKFANPVELVKDFNTRKDWEGLVGSGYKLKFWRDLDDWKVQSIDLKNGPTGKVAGVVWFKSLESDKEFKLGPGQLGTEDFCKSIMENPEAFIGMVAKVASRNGHEGRAAKFSEWHLDK